MVASTHVGAVQRMGFGPDLGQTGMTPNDWSETEARRKERATQVASPHGRDIGSGSRRAAGVILAVIALALMSYAIGVMVGAIDIVGSAG